MMLNYAAGAINTGDLQRDALAGASITHALS
jgi:hypothetical protein